MPTITSAQGYLTGDGTPNDTISLSPVSGTYTLEYPIGTVIAAASSTPGIYNIGAGQFRLSANGGSTTYTVNRVADAGSGASVDATTGAVYVGNQNAGSVSKYGKLRKSPVYSQRHMGAMNTGYGAGTARTWSLWADCDVRPIMARLRFEFQEAAAVAIVRASIAPHDGTTAYPTASGTPLAATFGGTVGFTTAVNGASSKTASPTTLLSDWIALPTYNAQSNGCWGAMGRVYFDGTTAYSYWTNAADFAVNASTAMRSRKLVSSGQAGVDGITTPASFTNASPDTVGIIAGIDFLTASDTTTVLVAGDSVASGLYAVGDIDSATREAVMNIAASGYPIALVNAAFGGTSPTVYQPRAKAFVTADQPTVAVYYATSINTPMNSQARADADFALVMDFVRHCIANSCFPIIATGAPHNVGSVGADVYRQAFKTKLIAAGASSKSFIVADTSTPIEDPTAPYRILAAYDSGQPGAGIHPNSAGQVASAAPIEAALRALIG